MIEEKFFQKLTDIEIKLAKIEQILENKNKRIEEIEKTIKVNEDRIINLEKFEVKIVTIASIIAFIISFSVNFLRR